MEKIKIYSPQGIPNKEKYLNEELTKLTNREIVLIEKRDNGDIEISVKYHSCKIKYFVKVIKTKEKELSISDLTKEKWYNEIIKSAVMINKLEYAGFCVLFFKK